MASAEIHDLYDSILILDFGSQVSLRLRGADGWNRGWIRVGDVRNGVALGVNREQSTDAPVLASDHPTMP